MSVHIPTETKNNVTSISDLVNSSISSSINACTNPTIETTVITENIKNPTELIKIRVKNLMVDRLLPKTNLFVK